MLALKAGVVVLVLTVASFSPAMGRTVLSRTAVGSPGAHGGCTATGTGEAGRRRRFLPGDGDCPKSDGVEPSFAGDPVGNSGPSVPLSEQNRRGPRRSVVAEAVLGVVILAITTVLTGTAPISRPGNANAP